MGYKLAIADPPYLGRANRWYGDGCGDGYGQGKADNHPEASLWDLVETHWQLIDRLENEFDGWAIALSVHSLSQYLQKIETDSRNGIRVMVWHKPSSSPSGSRVGSYWEPVIVRVPATRKGWTKGKSTKDVLSANPPRNGFVGAKPIEWTHWILDVLGYQEGDEVFDLFNGSGAVTEAIQQYKKGAR